MSIPLHWKIRRNLRTILNNILLKLISPKANFDKIDPNSINRILLIRLNYRIGNIIFMTPLIRAIEKNMPHIKIDMLVGAGFTKSIIQGMPNIQNVYDMPRDLLKSPLKLFKLVNKINKNNYDLIISPVVGSVSSNIAVTLLKAPIKLGLYEPNSYSALNRFVYKKDGFTHSAIEPLAIMDIFFNQTPPYEKYLDIAINEEEKKFGEDYISDLLEKNHLPKDKKIIGIFRDARNDKKIPDDWWIEFITNLREKSSNILLVDILNPNEIKPLIEDMPYIKEKNLRTLGAIFSALDRFICADTGPMHLASASLTPVIALFNSTSPSKYGPLGQKDEVIVINDKDIKDIANEAINIINQGTKI